MWLAKDFQIKRFVIQGGREEFCHAKNRSFVSELHAGKIFASTAAFRSN